MKTQETHNHNSEFPVASGGFSLVEVVLAVGIVSFCLVAILGALFSGYRENASALDKGDAARSLGIVANSLRASSVVDGEIVSSEQFGLRWKLSGPSTNYTLYLTGENDVTDNPQTARHKIEMSIRPSAAGDGSSAATIVVAWPAASSQITWNGPNATVSGAQGSEMLHLYLNAD